MTKLAYRINEAVAATGLGRTTLYALIKDGKLTTTKIGGCTIIMAEELDRMLRRSLPANET